MVWSLSAAAPSLAAAYAAAQVGLGSAPREGKALWPRLGWASGAERAGQARALGGPGRRAAPGFAPSALRFLLIVFLD